MSSVRFNISDRDTTIHGDLHGSFTDALIATLTAEPETLAEFESALTRYIKPESGWRPLQIFRSYEDLEPYDAGIVAIDLAGRTVGYDSTYSYPCSEGSVRVPNEFADSDEPVYIPYRLPDDWLFVRSVPLFEGARRTRREERAGKMPVDARPVMYGRPLIEHIVGSINEAPNALDQHMFADVHARWLMTPRADLRGRSPREVLFEKRDFLDFDLHTRSLQWSFTKVCPPALNKDSYAYQNAGFATHEWVLYYDLIRHLMSDAMDGRRASGTVDAEAEIARLQTVRDNWLHAPDSESWGRLPIEVIDSERRRVNLTASAAEILIDENCPCCRALAEDFDTPMFTYLDGCNMDDRFEFSPYATIEEWEANQREMEQWDRESEAKQRSMP